MTSFTFDLDGLCGTCCEPAFLKQIQMPRDQRYNFTIKKCKFFHQKKKLVVEIVEEDERLENAVHCYLTHALRDSVYSISKPQTSVFYRWIYAALGLVTGSIVLILSATTTLTFPLNIVLALCTGVLTLVLGLDSIKKAKTDLSTWQPGVDTLFVLSASTAFLFSTASLFWPHLPMMFDLGLFLFGFRHLGTALKETFNAQMNEQPSYVELVAKRRYARINPENSRKEQIAYEDLKQGDSIEIQVGEYIPLDGQLLSISGSAETYAFDLSLINGTTLAKTYRPSEKVLAGMKALTACRLLVEGRNSYLVRLDEAVFQAALTSTQWHLSTEPFLRQVVPVMLLAAAMTALALACFFPPMLALHLGMAVLVSVCPCTLGLISPIAMEFARARAREQGIRVLDSAALERLAAADTLVFDLHQTLTQGKMSVNIRPIAEEDAETVHSWISSLEKNAKHFIGKAIHRQAKKLCRDDLDCSDWVEEARGVRAKIADKELYLGDHLFIKEHLGIENQPGLIYLFDKEHHIYAQIQIRDALRPDAKLTLKHSPKFGFSSRQLATGADFITAKTYANQLNIQDVDVHAGLSAFEGQQSKVQLINSLQKQGRNVLMVGDGMNDSLAMQAANVAILMVYADAELGIQPHSPTLRISEQAGLLALLKAKEIAMQAMASIHQNFYLSLFCNLLALALPPLAWFGFGLILHPALGAAFMVLQIALVFANAYRWSLKPLQSSAIALDDDESVSEFNLMSFEK